MTVLPIITRELRTQARQPFTHWLRSAGLLLLLICSLVVVGERLLEPGIGGRLFGVMHLICYLSIWILVPLSAADCLSRERREGTLGLLFLTPLKPPHIVVAKGLAHGLRAATLVVAVVPAMTIPFLLGGVSWQQVTVSVIANACAICWSLAAALFASAIGRKAHQAIALAMFLTGGSFLLLPWIVGVLIGIGSQTTWMVGYSQGAYDFMAGFSVVGMPGDWLSEVAPWKQIAWSLMVVTVTSLGVLIFAIILAGERIRRSWQEEPPSARVQQMERVFCRPIIAVGYLRRWMRWQLERNPVGWLEQRSWSGRMVTWVWLAIMVSVLSLALTEQNFFRNSEEIQLTLACLLVLSMAATGAGSFRRERETGVLELLLVSPLSAGRIIKGRLFGLWGQFLPSVVLLLGIWIYLINIFPTYGDDSSKMVVFFATSFVTLPAVGLYFSVRCRTYIGALLITLLMTFLAPFLLAQLTAVGVWLCAPDTDNFPWDEMQFFLLLLIQIAIAVWLSLRLQNRLEHRSFHFQPLMN